jgi:hypothetical protein
MPQLQLAQVRNEPNFAAKAEREAQEAAPLNQRGFKVGRADMGSASALALTTQTRRLVGVSMGKNSTPDRSTGWG